MNDAFHDINKAFETKTPFMTIGFFYIVLLYIVTFFFAIASRPLANAEQSSCGIRLFHYFSVQFISIKNKVKTCRVGDCRVLCMCVQCGSGKLKDAAVEVS